MVALPPLDLFADVRVLMARASSTPAFGFGVVAAVVARAAVLAAVLGFNRKRFLFTLRFYLAALVPALVASSLDFSGRSILYAYLIWGALLITLATFGALGASAWIGRDTLHLAVADSGRDAFRSGAIAAYLVVLTLVGLLWRDPGATKQVLVVPLSGALTALAAYRLSSPPSRRLSLRGFAIAGTAAFVIVVVITLVLPRLNGSDNVDAASPHGGSLVLIAGVDTSTGQGALFRLNPRTLGFSCSRTYYYSYRGLGRGGSQGDAWCPIRTGAVYDKSDTTSSLPQLALRLRAQLAFLPRPITIVTHLQGAWIAWSEIIGDGAKTPVRSLVMLAPFSEGLAPYPPAGESGTGAAGGEAVRAVTDLGRSLGINKFDPDAPLSREMQATSGAVQRLVSRRLPLRVRGLAVLARADLPLEPRPWPNGLPETCPGWLTHAALPGSSKVLTTVNNFLDGGIAAPCSASIRRIGHLTDAYGAPSPAA